MDKFFKNYISEHTNNIRAIIVLLLVVFILVILTIVSGGENNSLTKGNTVSKLSLTDPLRQLYQADDLVINVQPLRDELAVMENNRNVSIYFEALSTGANISINKDEEFYPASLLKVPLIMAVTKKIEQGTWRWDTELELTEADKNRSFGTLWQEPAGTHLTIEALAKELLTHSDNTAYFVLLNNIDPSEILKVQRYLGIQDFISNNLEISAKKYVPILRSLFSATYLSVENSEKILKWMSESDFTNYLAGGVPTTTRFSHKIGIEEERQSYIDAGIVYLENRPYILIVMVKGFDGNKADSLMRFISQKVYGYIADYPQNI